MPTHTAAQSNYQFNHLASYVEALEITHHNLPEVFMRSERLAVNPSQPDTSLQLKSEAIGNDVFRTTLEMIVRHSITGLDQETYEEKRHDIYTIRLAYSALTRIDDAESIPEMDRNRILQVDVPHLLFPDVCALLSTLAEHMKATPIRVDPVDFADLFMRGAAD